MPGDSGCPYFPDYFPGLPANALASAPFCRLAGALPVPGMRCSPVGQFNRQQLPQPPLYRALSLDACQPLNLPVPTLHPVVQMPTLIDSTMFSLKSFSHSYSSTLRCNELYRRALSIAMPTRVGIG